LAIALSSQLGRAAQTARSIIKKIRETGDPSVGRKGGKTVQKITEEVGQFLLDKVESQPTITLKELRQLLLRQFRAENHVCVQTISRFLDGQLITLKQLRSAQIQWNQPADKIREARILSLAYERRPSTAARVSGRDRLQCLDGEKSRSRFKGTARCENR
jgi:transposase